MVAFKEFEEGTEVIGPACWVVIDGLGAFKSGLDGPAIGAALLMDVDRQR